MDCVICLDEVDSDHGSYCCSRCRFIVHVECATKVNWYSVIESVEKYDDDSTSLSEESRDSYIVIGRNEEGKVTKIRHFCHERDLISSDMIPEEYKFCDGCTSLISDSFYCCSECNFFLHKKCVAFPRKQHFWLHECERPVILVAGNIFKCSYCRRICNGFAYDCPRCGINSCLQCATPYTLTFEGHEHPLFFLYMYERSCTGCGEEISEERNPSHWFYCCGICDTSAHLYCVVRMGEYPFIKPGKIYKEGEHPHPLRFVKKMYYYPECFECGVPCQDLALQCMEPGCEFIVHWECACPSDLRE
ncbi:uncharacterized protein LOC120211337 [Hibiscus syriacus]|uniref:uncharacterized protein LOC120211337 n=1 Tax=Hibiscus syriacus TaxID=106335 RepID=UPI0019242F10|nr:uncharacterized protein LOC120211337 [Hibiscus syriacus]